MNKARLLSCISATMAFQAQANFIELDSGQFNWEESIDVNGDGISDYNTFTQRNEDPLSSITPADGNVTEEQTRTDTFFFTGVGQSQWTESFLLAGTEIGTNTAFSTSDSAIYSFEYTRDVTREFTGDPFCAKPENANVTGLDFCFTQTEGPWERSLTIEDHDLFGRGLLGIGLESEGETFYGWLDIEFSENQVDIYDGILSTENQMSVNAGQRPALVSEPSMIALLATGLLGGALARRRKMLKKVY